jgi:hypothetical protein
VNVQRPVGGFTEFLCIEGGVGREVFGSMTIDLVHCETPSLKNEFTDLATKKAEVGAYAPDIGRVTKPGR